MADIELVIKIPEEMYQKIKEGEELGIPLWLVYEIANGTPLPKWHGRLIDENDLLGILKCEEYEICTWRNCSDCNREKCIKRHNLLSVSTIIEADEESEE